MEEKLIVLSRRHPATTMIRLSWSALPVPMLVVKCRFVLSMPLQLMSAVIVPFGYLLLTVG